MKKKLVAILRSLVLLVVLALALVSTPFEVFGSGDSMVAVRGIRKLVQATWIAIGWISIETAIAWFQALRRPRPGKGVIDREPPRDQAAEPPAPASSAK
jgi:hypothetical protein